MNDQFEPGELIDLADIAEQTPEEPVYIPDVSFELADRLRTSRRVLFEKVARRPSEYLTVLTGFNYELLIAFAWECCEFLDHNNYVWCRHWAVDDDCFDWVITRHDMSVLLLNLFRMSDAEIFYLEWNAFVTLAFRYDDPTYNQITE